MAKFGIGQPVRRVEDPRLVTGAGRYTDDINLPRQAYGFVLRSPARPRRASAASTPRAAKAAPGVLAVLTGADLAGSAGLPSRCMIPLKNRDGSSRADPPHPVLCKDEVRHVGDPVAFVVAETPAAGARRRRAGRGRLRRRCRRSPTRAAALDAGAPQVRPEAPGNVAFDWDNGDQAATDAAFAAPRTSPSSTSSTTASSATRWSRAARSASTTRRPAATRCGPAPRARMAAARTSSPTMLGHAADKVRVVTPDVGGGFGMKIFLYPEYTLPARRPQLGRPVKWRRRPRARASSPTRTAATTSPRPSWRSTPTAAYPGAARSHHRQHRRLSLQLRALHPDRRGRQVLRRRLRHSGGATSRSTASSPTPSRSTPTAAPAGPKSLYCVERLIDDGGPRARRRPGRAAPAQLHPPGADALQDGRRPSSTTAATSPAS